MGRIQGDGCVHATTLTVARSDFSELAHQTDEAKLVRVELAEEIRRAEQRDEPLSLT